jgi:hypothetical protein
MKMKYLLKLMPAALLSAVFLFMNALTASGQAQILTKKAKISDITDKTVKIVLTGNDFVDSDLIEEVKNRWRLSPYEFCTLKEFNDLKTDSDYYFLMFVKGQFRHESTPGITFLTLVKGGEEATKSIDKMLNVVTMPFAASEEPSGREFVFLPAFLDIIQDYARKALESDLHAYAGLSNYSMNIIKAENKRIYFSKNDLSKKITETVLKKYFDEDMLVMNEDTADKAFTDKTFNTLVSYTVSPSAPVRGSYCYKMLIDAYTHKLYYFRRCKINVKKGSGFITDDIKRIAAVR